MTPIGYGLLLGFVLYLLAAYGYGMLGLGAWLAAAIIGDWNVQSRRGTAAGAATI